MRALVIGQAERDRIDALRERAAQAPFSLDEIERMSAGFDPKNPASRSGREIVPADFTIDIPQGYRVTYTLEQQPVGLCRHLSVSVDEAGRAPSHLAVATLLSAFGFEAVRGALAEQEAVCMIAALEAGRLCVYPEHYATGRVAVNMIEPI